MLFKNVSSDTVSLNARNDGLGPMHVAPGGVVDVPDWAATPSRTPGGMRRLSVIEQLVPQLVPADEKQIAEWSAVPDPSAKSKKAAIKAADIVIPDLEDLIKQGFSPAKARNKIATLMAEKSLAEQGDAD